MPSAQSDPAVRAGREDDLQALVARFEEGRIDPDSFGHREHVHVAWACLELYPPEQAYVRFDAALRRLTRNIGAERKYHATVTGFLLWLIAERRATAGSQSWPAFAAANPDLLERGRDLLHEYYEPERLDSELARRQFLLPALARMAPLRQT